MGSKRTYENDNLRDAVIGSVAAVLAVEATKLDVRQSFLYHGGHSLLAIALSSKCKSRGIFLSVESILRSVSVTQLADLAYAADQRCTASSKRQKLHSSSLSINPTDSCALTGRHGRFKALASIASSPPTSPNVRIPPKNFDLTEMQATLLSGSQRNPGVNMIQFFDTFASVHIPKMKEAWQRVIEMEPIFRLCQMSNSDTEGGWRTKETLFKWSEIVCDNLTDYHTALAKVSFETSVTTSFKAVTMRQKPEPDITTIIWDVHHALIDGYSASLVYKKVRRAAEGHSIRPGRSFFRVAKDIKKLQEKISRPCWGFWEQQKSLFPHTARDILLRQPVTVPLDTATVRSISVPMEKPDVLSYCRQHGITVAAVHYSAWAVVLSKYSDSDSVAFGAVMSGRSLPIEGIEDTIGPLINTLPFYATVTRAEDCGKFMQRIFGQMVQLEPLQASTPKDGYLRDFSSAIAMEVDIGYTEAASIQPVAPNSFKVVSDIPITILVRPDATAYLSYRTERFNHDDIELLVEQYSNALASLVLPDTTVGSCLSVLLPRRCRRALLNASNYDLKETTREAVHNDLVTLFEATAARHGPAIAVEMHGAQLSYVELNNRADRVAGYLRGFIKTGDVVCVHADRSINWIIAIYGILKAGGIYAPFDPSLPEKIREANYKTAGASVYLTPKSLQKEFAPSACRLIFSVEDILNLVAYGFSTSSELHERLPDPDAPAYICFTSGSTGTPKGVLCHHAGLVAFQRDKEVRLHAEPGCVIAQIMSPAFDGSIHEIFSALSYGATLILSGTEDMTSHLVKATSAILTPSLAKVLDPDDYPLLQNVYLVGEPVSQQINDAWARVKNLYNMYGPTEATCGATIKRLQFGKPVTIGRPNPSSRVYILDRYHEMCPPGVVGDIYIAGVQVARGYLNRSDETLRRFLPDSLSRISNQKMYWTGDRGYWDSSMEIHCLGRSDRQIKLNGFRLDLNALEDQISRDVPEISAIALVRKADFLLAVVQPASIDTRFLRLEFAHSLPPYAVPRHIVSLDKFPTTIAGKLDYAALANLPIAEENGSLSVQWTNTQSAIASIWREVLNLDHRVVLTPKSSFIALGGHSISQLLLANRLSTVFKRTIPLQVVMESQTLYDLAVAVDRLSSVTSKPRNETSLKPNLAEVSAIEAEWFQKYQIPEGSSAFSVSVAWEFDPQRVDRRRLELAWNDTIDKHKVLRSFYMQKHPQALERRYHDLPARAQCVDHINITKEINHPFLLEKDHLIRVFVSTNQMLVSISHIICDLTTLRSLLNEVASLYLKNSSPRLSDEHRMSSTQQLEDSRGRLEFWSTYLDNSPPTRFFQHSIPDRRVYAGFSDTRRLPSDLFTSLRQFSYTHSYTFHQLGLAAVCLASQSGFGPLDLVVGAPYLNRQSADMDTIGLFLEPLPIRIRYQPKELNEPTTAFLDIVRHSSQSAIAHAVSWTRLLQHLNIAPDFPNHPLFDVMVTFHDNRSASLLQLSTFEPLHIWSSGSKFKIMFEFTAHSDDNLTLRIEYDNECFTGSEIVKLQVLVVEALGSMVADMGLSEVQTRLRNLATTTEDVCPLETVTIGSLVNHSN